MRNGMFFSLIGGNNSGMGWCNPSTVVHWGYDTVFCKDERQIRIGNETENMKSPPYSIHLQRQEKALRCELQVKDKMQVRYGLSIKSFCELSFVFFIDDK